ncbi:UNVERIFIED_CONTAM: hypothetical protein HDU68_001906 [Siphonaria sp. JEL0065]|nr:hypothetical protein HDU68_001906 [Siphonaria sp. JEL0065]
MSNLLLYKNYGDASCSTPPVQLNYVQQPSLADCQGNATAVVGCATSPYFVAYTAECLPPNTTQSQAYESTAAKVFGSAPYVEAMIYTANTCTPTTMYNLRQYRVGGCYQFNGNHEDPQFSYGGLSRKAGVTVSLATGALTNFTIQIYSDSQCQEYSKSISFVANDVECQPTTFFNSRTSYVVLNVFNSNAISGPAPTGTSPGTGNNGNTNSSSSDFIHSSSFYGVIAAVLIVLVVGSAFWRRYARKHKNNSAEYVHSAGQVNHTLASPANYSAPASFVSAQSIAISQNGNSVAQNERLGVYGSNQLPPAYSITADGRV